MSFARGFLDDIAEIATLIDYKMIDDMATIMANKLNTSLSRLFILGCGGSAANSSHAVGDFRKLCNINAYTPFDNIAEMTARINDDGWDFCFVDWLKFKEVSWDDVVLIISVGGGDADKNISKNIVEAIKYVRDLPKDERGCPYIMGIVGKSHGYTAIWADKCVVVPQVDKEMITPYSESFQSIILHLLASHPLLKMAKTKWESVND